ncbi:methylated-DNA--[protein]-cysteine S-methyltransferase [Marichromatium gracile]|uniref:methylated-DNA--[protein]-cysteine S-methyltransferase n=1 Tax=Marichromatium gracile TaxID=1048 RepID=UPI001F4718D9|nr:methylated-DNA--[protein]-cysteine S-methyltransferase [Marichromatium gracile]MCF1182587.1 methylated-DNA--[protein]-cysteine S-methyltransferase [Marichromatium gracile]
MAKALIQAPFGPIAVDWRGGALAGGDLVPQGERDGAVLPDWVRAEFVAYLENPGHRIDLPLQPAGTAFQQRVWSALRAIPPGRPCTYGELAARLGSSARAIGQACRANPCPLVVPCHRVVGRRGAGGFGGARAGAPLAVKRWLLRHEGWEED